MYILFQTSDAIKGFIAPENLVRKKFPLLTSLTFYDNFIYSKGIWLHIFTLNSSIKNILNTYSFVSDI